MNHFNSAENLSNFNPVTGKFDAGDESVYVKDNCRVTVTLNELLFLLSVGDSISHLVGDLTNNARPDVRCMVARLMHTWDEQATAMRQSAGFVEGEPRV